MELTSWILFATIITLASISPGPNVLAVIVNTIDKGVQAAVFTILGNLVALFTIAFIAAIGVGAMLQAMPSVFSVMKFAGGVYLAWMGFRMFKSSFAPISSIQSGDADQTSTKIKPINLMIQAMLISYSNPKSILFLSAVFPTFLSTSGSIAFQFSIMFVTIICIVTLIHGSYAILALRLKGHLITGRTRRWMSRLSGVSFMGFGAGFVVDSQR